jgi:hypothetical protein
MPASTVSSYRSAQQGRTIAFVLGGATRGESVRPQIHPERQRRAGRALQARMTGCEDETKHLVADVVVQGGFGPARVAHGNR